MKLSLTKVLLGLLVVYLLYNMFVVREGLGGTEIFGIVAGSIVLVVFWMWYSSNRYDTL
jgi:hypothetical protein